MVKYSDLTMFINRYFMQYFFRCLRSFWVQCNHWLLNYLRWISLSFQHHFGNKFLIQLQSCHYSNPRDKAPANKIFFENRHFVWKFRNSCIWKGQITKLLDEIARINIISYYKQLSQIVEH